MPQLTPEQAAALVNALPELVDTSRGLRAAADRLAARGSGSKTWRDFLIPVAVAVLSAIPAGVISGYIGVSVKQAELTRDVAALRDQDDVSRRERGELRSQMQSLILTTHEVKETLAGVVADIRSHQRELDQHDRRLIAVEARRGQAGAPEPPPPLLTIDFAAPPPTPPMLSAMWVGFP